MDHAERAAGMSRVEFPFVTELPQPVCHPPPPASRRSWNGGVAASMHPGRGPCAGALQFSTLNIPRVRREDNILGFNVMKCTLLFGDLRQHR